jgi:hypothetical protein
VGSVKSLIAFEGHLFRLRVERRTQ